MKKRLPEIKKKISEFILEEDAKIVDKTASKIALTSSFFAISALTQVNDANAQGHGNHTNHANNIAHASDHKGTYDLPSDRTENIAVKDDDLSNEGSEVYETSISTADRTVDIEVESKSLKTVHGNHYNHSDGGGSS